MEVPRLKLEYSYAIDMYCPLRVEPEALEPWQLALIPKISIYQVELIQKLDWFQFQWDTQGVPLLMAAMNEVGAPFPVSALQAAVFLCPRYPFMGTPLAFNAISYLESSADDIPSLGGQPLPVFFFISTAFHEVLHKYITSLLKLRPSRILQKIPNETPLYRAHLHLFALQRKSFESLGLSHLLPHIKKLESLHGLDYKRAWESVYSNNELYRELLGELKWR